MPRSATRLPTTDEQRKAAIRTAVAAARRALSDGLQKALADVGVLADGTRIPPDDLPDPWEAAKVRPAVDATLERWQARGFAPRDAVARYVREASYTWLNRLAAVHALSAHGLIAPLARLEESGRSQLLGSLLEVAPVLQRAREIAEAALWQSVFEELALRVGALFDPLDAHGALFPGSLTLGEATRALSALSDEQWRADDTLGWCYQFFTTKPERAALRAKKGAAFTADDLGPINQFYTPHWIVRYLVDNTLGALWRRMRPDSRIADFCTFLLPATADDTPREPKRVRDIRIIDPACGAMHFGVYAFDVLTKMYDEEGIESPRNVPRLILERNLAGIDIDRRAIQIAALNLYLKAASAYRRLGETAPADLRLNLACTDVAPPVPERAAELRAQIDDPLVRRGFDVALNALQALPAVGSLFDLDRDVRAELARDIKRRDATGGTLTLELPGLLDQIGLDERAEPSVLDALIERARAFAFDAFEHEEPSVTLLASDVALAAKALDLVRGTYDVVLMNPPYGETMPPAAKNYLRDHYPKSSSDLYGAFYELAFTLASGGGAVGALTSKTFLYLESFKHVRKLFIEDGRLVTLADGGDKILDESSVDVAAVVGFAERPRAGAEALVFRLLREPEREVALAAATARVRGNSGDLTEYTYRPKLTNLRKLPTQTLAYWAPIAVLSAYDRYPALEPIYGIVRQGLATGDNDRFVRYHWEVPSENIGRNNRWVPFTKGGDYSPFYEPLARVIDWADDGADVVAFSGSVIRNRQYYFREGLTYPNVADRFHARLLAEPAIFSHGGPIIVGDYDLALLGYLNSKVAQALLMAQSPTRNFEVGQLQRLCVPPLKGMLGEALTAIARSAVDACARFAAGDEVDRRFTEPWMHTVAESELLAAARAAVNERKAFCQVRETSQKRATEFVSAEMGFTSEDWAQIDHAFGPEIGEEKSLRIRGFRSVEIQDPLVAADEQLRRYLSGMVRRMLQTEPILRRESCLSRVQHLIEKRFSVGRPMEAATELLGTSVAHWLDREFHRYHLQLYEKRPRIVRISAVRDRIVFFIDALGVSRDDLRAMIATELVPEAQRARADVAAGTRGATRAIAEEILDDVEHLREHFERILDRWGEGADDIRPRIELLRPLAPYLPQ